MNSKRVLVTGATGKVGSRFVPRLLARGYGVRLLARGEASRTKAFADHGAEVVAGDLVDPEAIEQAVAGVDAIVHLAAFFRGATPEQAHATNHEATNRLAQAAMAHRVGRFVFASTNLVYGPEYDRPVRESEPARPQGAYPETKLAAEAALLDLHRREGLGLRIMRLSFVYGEGDSHLPEALPMLKAWPPSKRFQLVHHADVGAALLLGLQTDGIDGEIFNVADDAPLTLGELRGLHGLDEAAEGEPSMAWGVMADTRKIRQVLGYRPHYPTFYGAWAAGAL